MLARTTTAEPSTEDVATTTRRKAQRKLLGAGSPERRRRPPFQRGGRRPSSQELRSKPALGSLTCLRESHAGGADVGPATDVDVRWLKNQSYGKNYAIFGGGAPSVRPWAPSALSINPHSVEGAPVRWRGWSVGLYWPRSGGGYHGAVTVQPFVATDVRTHVFLRQTQYGAPLRAQRGVFFHC